VYNSGSVMRTRVEIPCKRVENYQCEWQVGDSLQKEVATLMYSRFTKVGPIRKASRELSTVIARGENGRVLSGLYVEFHRTRFDKIVAHIHYVATLKDFERRGFGSEVLRQIWNIPTLHCLIADVQVGSGIADFYTRKGFRRLTEKDLLVEELQSGISEDALICTKQGNDQFWSWQGIDCRVEWFDPFLVKSMKNTAGKLEARMHVLPTKWVTCDASKLFYSADFTGRREGIPLPGKEVFFPNAVWLLPYSVQGIETISANNVQGTETISANNVHGTETISAKKKTVDMRLPSTGAKKIATHGFDTNEARFYGESLSYKKDTASNSKKSKRSANISPSCTKRKINEVWDGKINELWDRIRRDIAEYYTTYPTATSMDNGENTTHRDSDWEIIY